MFWAGPAMHSHWTAEPEPEPDLIARAVQAGPGAGRVRDQRLQGPQLGAHHDLGLAPGEWPPEGGRVLLQRLPHHPPRALHQVRPSRLLNLLQSLPSRTACNARCEPASLLLVRDWTATREWGCHQSQRWCCWCWLKSHWCAASLRQAAVQERTPGAAAASRAEAAAHRCPLAAGELLPLWWLNAALLCPALLHHKSEAAVCICRPHDQLQAMNGSASCSLCGRQQWCLNSAVHVHG